MAKRHLLVTNDFPPKIGGIQNYLWEFWRRLPEDTAVVYTTPYKDADVFDKKQRYPILRSPEPVLLPYPWLKKRIKSLVSEYEIDLVLFDPAWPLGFLGPWIDTPYGVILHGAEVVIPSRIPGFRSMIKKTLEGASLVIANSQYPLDEAEKCVGHALPSVVVHPGVDLERFSVCTSKDRDKQREEWEVMPEELLISSVSRLVPRKGMKTLISAVAAVSETLPVRLIIGGTGREEKALRRQAEQLEAPVQLVGKLEDAEVVSLYQSSDLMAMVCNKRWGGLEQEGFGIVFLEAAACGIPQIAGTSGGAQEAVVHGETGLVVDDATSVAEACQAIEKLCRSTSERKQMGEAARSRVEKSFSYELLARKLHAAINR